MLKRVLIPIAILSIALVPLFADLSNGIVAYYEFEGNANDVTGNEYDGVVNGPSPVSGKIGQCYNFDGNDDWIDLANNFGIFDGSTDFSISLWFNPDDVSPGQVLFYPKAENAVDIAFSSVLEEGELGFRSRMDNIWETRALKSDISTNNWYHVVAIYDNSYGWKMYINGLNTGNGDTKTGQIGSKNIDNVIGRNSSETGRYFDGKIDEVGVWNKALTTSEVESLYNNGNGYSYNEFGEYNPNSGLVAYYPFNGSASDESGNGTDGTKYGAPALTNDRLGNENSAFMFDGIDDCITFPDLGIVDGSQNWSISIWVKPDRLGSNDEYIISFRGEEKLNFYWQGETGSGDFVVKHKGNIKAGIQASEFSRGNWYHLVYNYDSNTGGKLYLNNFLKDSGPTYSNHNINNINTIGGFDGEGGDGYFKGIIDDIRIYNRVLTENEINDFYNENGYIDNDLTSDLVSYYNLEGNANDVTGNGNDGTPYGNPEITIGKIGQCYNFDGVDDYISCITEDFMTNNLDSTSSYCCWVYSSGDGIIFDRGYIKHEGCRKNGYKIWEADNNLYFKHCYVIPGERSCETFTISTNIPKDSFYYLSIIFNGKEANLYINGQLEKKVTMASNLETVGCRSDESCGQFKVGVLENYNNNFSDYFNGKIDEVGIWDRALTSTEVEALYNNGNGLTYSDGNFKEADNNNISGNFDLENNGDFIWTGTITFPVKENDKIESIDIQVSGEDISELCYTKSGEVYLPTFINLRSMSNSLNKKSEAKTTSINLLGEATSEQGEIYEVNESFEISKPSNLPFNSKIDDIPIDIAMDYFSEHNLGDIYSSLEVLHDYGEGNKYDVAESIADITLNSLIPSFGSIDFMARKVFGLDSYVINALPNDLPEDEVKRFRDDNIIFKALKMEMYLNIELGEYATSFDPLSGKYVGEFNSSPIPMFDDLDFLSWMGNVGYEIQSGFSQFVNEIKEFFKAFGFSPIDFVIIDENGDTLSVSNDGIKDSYYIEREDHSEGEWEDYCLIYKPKGNLKIVPVVEDDADPNETYSIKVSANNDTTIIANNENIDDIPDDGYIIDYGNLSSVDEKTTIKKPKNYSLMHNYPNPFNPVTTIKFGLPKDTDVNISIYNLNGELIETLIDNHKSAGYHTTTWNATNVPTGVYFYRIQAGEFTDVKKCILMK